MKMTDLNKEQWFVFTFGYGHRNGGYYVRIYGTYSSARAEMIRRYGTHWAFQYTEKQWEESRARLIQEGMGWAVETELIDY